MRKVLYFSSLLLLCLISFSCSRKMSQVPYKVCDKKYIQVIRDVKSKNIQSVEKFLKRGGDPNFRCLAIGGPTGPVSIPTVLGLSGLISFTNDYDMISMYLKYDVSNSSMSEILLDFIQKDKWVRNDSIVQLLVDKNAYYNEVMCDVLDTIYYADLIDNFGYNINNHNNEKNTSALISFTSCDYYLSTEEMIEGIKFFVRRGADVRHVSNEGSDVFTYVKDPVVIEFLKSLL